MIVELTVENVAIIERAQISVGPGFTVLTGETGAGKSLLVDAIELALGERADSDLVRAGCSRAVVSAVFDLSGSADLRQHCVDLGLNLEDQSLYVQREVFAEGRSQCRVGGRMAPVSALKSLGQLLVDLHGQHDHQSLLHADRHLGFLDGWIGEPASRQKAVVATRYAEWHHQQSRLAALRKGLRDREQRLDLLRFQIDEIESVDPQLGEMDELEGLLSRLTHRQKLVTAATESLVRLNDDESCAVDRLAASVRDLEHVERYDADLNSTLDPLRTALFTLEEAVRELRSYVDRLELDENQLELTAERIDKLRRLRRKYGEDERTVLAHLQDAREELDLLSEAEANEQELEASVKAAWANLELAATELTRMRTEKATEFSAHVQAQLRDLAMEKANFSVNLTPRTVDADGGDAVEFYFSANVGEPSRPLAKIASGGEISRVMLAIKTALAGRVGVPTLIFDEVDAGLSGRAAAVVANKLNELAAHYQVLAISHLPQIASRATAHFRIEKAEDRGRVSTVVRRLTHEERVEEIARMLAGEEVSESALANARELLSRS